MLAETSAKIQKWCKEQTQITRSEDIRILKLWQPVSLLFFVCTEVCVRLCSILHSSHTICCNHSGLCLVLETRVSGNRDYRTDQIAGNSHFTMVSVNL